MIQHDETVMVLVDVQGKLAQRMHNREQLFANLEKLIRAMHLLEVPVLWVEQIPEKMGPTLPRLAALLSSRQPIVKTAFSCCGEPAFVRALQETKRRNVLLAGIETHVCVYQTASELTVAGYTVDVVADAVSSRTRENKEIGLGRITARGAVVTSTELAILELTRDATHPRFRDILQIIK